MQARAISGIFALVWSGLWFQAGRLSERKKHMNFSQEKREIQIPSIQQHQAAQNNEIDKKLTNTDTFVQNLIQPSIRLVQYPNFRVLYSTLNKCPLAVHEKIDKSLAVGDAPRRTSFFPQQSIQEEFRVNNDHFRKTQAYKNFSLARGHMAAAGNYSGNKQAKFQTFTYANVVPQNQSNNGGIWNTFERYARNLVINGKCENVQIISGPIFSNKRPYISQDGDIIPNVFKQQSVILLQNGITVPQKLYKIIKCNTQKGTFMDGFEFDNKKTYDNQKPLRAFVSSLSSIEKQTGLKFNFQKIIRQRQGVRINLKSSIGSLVQYDAQSFNITKKQYDSQFFNKLIADSQSIDEMKGAFYRAKQQEIYIEMQNYHDKVEKLFNQELKKLKNNFKVEPTASCQNLNQLMKLNKSLFVLKQLNEFYQTAIQKAELEPLNKCLSKKSLLREKKWEEFGQAEQANTELDRKQKVNLNSVTYAITRSLLKKTQIQKEAKSQQELKRRLFTYANQDKLKSFIIEINKEEQKTKNVLDSDRPAKNQ